MSAFRASSRVLNALTSASSRSASRSQATASSAAQHCLHVRPWDGFATPAHVFAIVRELEKRFGPVKTITTPKSLDGTPGGYHSYAWFEFEEPLPVQHGELPSELEYLVVEKPDVISRPGGIGLDDLAGLLERGERQNQSQWAAVMDTIDGDTRPVIDVKLGIGSPGLKSQRKPRFRRGLKTVQAATCLATFPGFSARPVMEIEAVQSHWKPLVAGRLPPRDDSPPKNDRSVALNPLEGYTAAVLAKKPLPPVPPPSSTAVESAPPLDHETPTPRLSAPLETVPLTVPVTIKAEPIPTPPFPCPATPEDTQTSVPKPADTKQVSKRAKMLGLARESALKELQLKRKKELEQRAERRKKAHAQTIQSGSSKAAIDATDSRSGLFSFLRGRS
ncbi:hypothetical protein FRB96_004395 [Tulasnella sp. 330]|nr:hypothetical protein FRB96_004395 [Tulasnella sp. 330]